MSLADSVFLLESALQEKVLGSPYVHRRSQVIVVRLDSTNDARAEKIHSQEARFQVAASS